MLPISPVATVCQVLQHLCTTAEINAAILRKSEAATRAALIDPLLRVLGWDTSNVQMLEPEKTLGSDLRVDYLLKDASQTPRIVVEAKCLGSVLDKYGYVGKILGYAMALDVQVVCITDGIDWFIHSNLHQGKSDPLHFSITKTSLLPAANILLRWLDAAQCGHSLPSASEPVKSESEVREETVSPSAKPAKKNIPKKAEYDAFVELQDVQSMSLMPGQKPKEIRLPDGTVKTIKTWKDILVETCLLVLKTNNNLSMPTPDKAGKKRHLFSKTKPLVGSSLSVPYKQINIFIYTHYSASDCISNAVRCGFNDSSK